MTPAQYIDYLFMAGEIEEIAARPDMDTQAIREELYRLRGDYWGVRWLYKELGPHPT